MLFVYLVLLFVIDDTATNRTGFNILYFGLMYGTHDGLRRRFRPKNRVLREIQAAFGT
jgi:hypothetical protein